MVEDEEGLVSALRSGLGRAGYAVDAATTGAGAMEKLATTAYDLAILDITLPDTSGLDLCRAVRRGEIEVASGRDLRVLMLTARASLADRVRGLDEGADDYLTKPFALVELLARIRALLRRDVTNGSTQLHVGDLVLDSSRHLATRAGRELPLTLKEFGVLRYLMSRPGHVVSAEETARARLGRERGPVHPERPGDRRHAAPQAHPGRRGTRAGNGDRPGLPAQR